MTGPCLRVLTAFVSISLCVWTLGDAPERQNHGGIGSQWQEPGTARSPSLAPPPLMPIHEAARARADPLAEAAEGAGPAGPAVRGGAERPNVFCVMLFCCDDQLNVASLSGLTQQRETLRPPHRQSHPSATSSSAPPPAPPRLSLGSPSSATRPPSSSIIIQEMRTSGSFATG